VDGQNALGTFKRGADTCLNLFLLRRKLSGDKNTGVWQAVVELTSRTKKDRRLSTRVVTGRGFTGGV